MLAKEGCYKRLRLDACFLPLTIQHRRLQRINTKLREQARWRIGAAGPAAVVNALEIIAEFSVIVPFQSARNAPSQIEPAKVMASVSPGQMPTTLGALWWEDLRRIVRGRTLEVADNYLVQYFQCIASRSLTTFGHDPTDVGNVLMRMTLANSSPSAAAVLRSMLALSSLHRDGLQPQAAELKISALRALAAASKNNISVTEAAQHVAAGMLLCSFEVNIYPSSFLHIRSMEMSFTLAPAQVGGSIFPTRCLRRGLYTRAIHILSRYMDTN
ncbi:hypothetical protein EYZ11_012321 [Aspergillus tanneri]|uniref:Uncharacterized protein n=1 Tax=Aspergillus tanneri TaxID=1220188 RepID=A0A4V3UMQ7_9EURO|nr:hypothetical protein EYZ11_012321 [Aspergillus tanneri]